MFRIEISATQVEGEKTTTCIEDFLFFLLENINANDFISTD